MKILRLTLVMLFISGLTLVSLLDARADEQSSPLQKFMADQYGPFDPSDNTWAEETDQIDMGKPVIAKYKICAHKTISTADSPRIMLGVCYVSGAPYIAGIASDFYILKAETGGALKIVMSLTQDQYSGPSDSPPVKIRIEKLGPHLFGFIERSYNACQGYTTVDDQIYLPWHGKITPSAGYIISKNNHNGLMRTESPRHADDLHLDMKIDDSDQKVDVYPLMFEEHGVEQGKKITRTFRASFDPLTGEYNLPQDMIQGY